MSDLITSSQIINCHTWGFLFAHQVQWQCTSLTACCLCPQTGHPEGEVTAEAREQLLRSYGIP